MQPAGDVPEAPVGDVLVGACQPPPVRDVERDAGEHGDARDEQPPPQVHADAARRRGRAPPGCLRHMP